MNDTNDDLREFEYHLVDDAFFQTIVDNNGLMRDSKHRLRVHMDTAQEMKMELYFLRFTYNGRRASSYGFVSKEMIEDAFVSIEDFLREQALAWARENYENDIENT